MPTTDLATALEQVRALLLDGERLVRAVGTGRRRGCEPPAVDRVELRPVDLRAGRHLQAVHRTGPAVRTHNHDAAAAPAAVDALLALPFGNWHVETADEVLQLRVTKRGQAQVHRAATSRRDVSAGPRAHDRARARLLDPGDPLFAVLGADADKRRQVDAFLRQLAPAVRDGLPAAPDADAPLRAVDLGCGNAYLTFAAHRWLAEQPRGARTVGVELREDLVARSAGRAGEAGLAGLSFTAGTIADADPVPDLGGAPDVVLALHACDTATDDALARAVRWGAPVVLAAPCCHHDVQQQIGTGTSGAPEPYAALVRHAILRERFADVLTDALRAQVLRLLGYRVDVVEFVDSRHTPRNALLRAVRTGAPPTPALVAEHRELTRAWGVVPALAERLRPELDAALAAVPAA
ncbi:SAM-dependent methyltransferase [Quadrisphaera sp. DSM 44207]|uniref:class I SAM-dependent methyltransferase n=1 Tax=Quadrisphaera sp. DSM 44207 TaxID=1881057 RepID=UPI0008847CA0|nr:SAM-dependent methyltransferase [Quadrisphaera sp. DSM 44207]SDQ65426.1 Methyltransferase domain-containing protein [Quadrisphaera sp. DSM 44207]